MNLSIKNVPEPLVYKLRERAARHHRSLQGELLTILEEYVGTRRPSIWELNERVERLGLNSPSESVQMIREDRDSR